VETFHRSCEENAFLSKGSIDQTTNSSTWVIDIDFNSEFLDYLISFIDNQDSASIEQESLMMDVVPKFTVL
jgi:hypothetical protein